MDFKSYDGQLIKPITKQLIVLCAAALTNLSMAYAGPVELILQRLQEKTNLLITAKTIKQFNFDQLIDHNDPSVGTFSQRYFIDETYGKEDDAPVFYYICGEWTCSKRDISGAIRTHAQKYHAKLIALEHRYYGKSLPFKSFSTHDLRYLTTEEAIEDLAYFQRQISKEKNWTGTWIAFGGSYPGSLSAYYRLKHPELVAGALASSAPVMAKEEFFEYDAHVAQVTGPKCTALMQEVVSKIEATLTNKEAFDQIKTLFQASDVQDPVDFLYLVADIGAGAVQYGKKDAFCKALSSSETPLQGYANFTINFFKETNTTAVQLTAQGLMSENPSDYKENGSAGFRQWYYQSCIEYGYWQIANMDRTNSTRSALINLDYHHQLCQRLFKLDKPSNTNLINNSFYFPLMNQSVTNIYFTNGEQDPWSKLSMMKKNGNTQNKKLTYRTIKDSAHCDDLHTPSDSDSKSLISARNTLQQLLMKWLQER